MMLRKIIPALFITTFMLLSCRKDREVAEYQGKYTLTGRVLDEITGQPVPNATVGVIERKREWMSAIAGKTAAFDKTDAGGSFTLTFEANSKENNYYLTAKALTYFERTDGGDPIRFTKNGSKKQDIRIMPYGYLARIIKGNKGGHKLSISWGGGGGAYLSGSDTISTVFSYPNKNIHFTYWVYFQDTSLNYKQSITLPPPHPHDTVYYLIEF